MSFSGKKFRRRRCINVAEFFKRTKPSTHTVKMMMSHAPIFSFIRLDEMTFIFKLIMKDKIMSQKFRLGEEFEMEKRNGDTIKITYNLEGDDVLNQVIKNTDGRIVYFRREFGDVNKMIVTVPGMNEPAVIYYEVIE